MKSEWEKLYREAEADRDRLKAENDRLRRDMTDRNRAMLDKWYRRTLWGHFGNTDTPTEEAMNKRVGMVVSYMLRMLSRGQIPNPDLVFDSLAGKHAPKCGTVGCFMDDWEHVH